MKKYLSLLLAVLMIVSVCLFTGCDMLSGTSSDAATDTVAGTETETETEPETEAPKPEALLASIEKALADSSYTMVISMNYDCDDATLAETLKAISMEIPVTVSGNDMHMSLSMDMMGYAITSEMTMVDKVLYQNVSIAGEAQKSKCTLTEEQIKDFMSESGTSLPVDYTSFENLTMEEKDGKQVITCTGITDAGKALLNDNIASSIGDTGAEAAIDNLSYIITLKDGKYESIALTCTYTMNVEGQSYTISMDMGTAFQYENVEKIVAPADAADYTEVQYSDIMG